MHASWYAFLVAEATDDESYPGKRRRKVKMIKKDLEQLNKDELLTMLLTVFERCDLLEKELTEARKLMEDTKDIAEYAGPVSELLDATRRKCADMETDAKFRCDQMIERAQVESQNYWDEVYSRIKRYSQATESLKDSVSGIGAGR